MLNYLRIMNHAPTSQWMFFRLKTWENLEEPYGLYRKPENHGACVNTIPLRKCPCPGIFTLLTFMFSDYLVFFQLCSFTMFYHIFSFFSCIHFDVYWQNLMLFNLHIRIAFTFLYAWLFLLFTMVTCWSPYLKSKPFHRILPDSTPNLSQ